MIDLLIVLVIVGFLVTLEVHARSWNLQRYLAQMTVWLVARRSAGDVEPPEVSLTPLQRLIRKLWKEEA